MHLHKHTHTHTHTHTQMQTCTHTCVAKHICHLPSCPSSGVQLNVKTWVASVASMLYQIEPSGSPGRVFRVPLNE
jgi:hypothetical protein